MKLERFLLNRSGEIVPGLEDLYKEIILDHYRNPRNQGELPVPPAVMEEGFNPLCGDEVKVYVFGTENRRILIKDTLFTDYFDGFEQQGLETLGENYFGQWREHAQNSIGLVDKQIVDFTGKE